MAYTHQALFSFEFFVEYVRVDDTRKMNIVEPAVAVRLLDFPKLLIYRSENDPSSKSGSETFSLSKENSFAYSFKKGVGKTTLVQKLCEVMASYGVSLNGFYTEEVRERGRRVGFDVVTLTGERGPLSRVGNEATVGKREYKVGQYVVDLSSFENLALPLFKNMDEGRWRVFVIDEIGKMELFSQAFIQSVRRVLDRSDCSVLGTIPIPKGKTLGLVEEIRVRKDVKVFMITKENRNAVFDEIVTALKEYLKLTSKWTGGQDSGSSG